MFKALADPARLQTLIILAERERNVGDLADIEGDKTGTVSARLKVLLQARLVKRRRDGKSVIYSVTDRHVLNMIEKAVEHATERSRKTPKEPKMSTCNFPKHEKQDHQHGPGCGHTAVRHGDHLDYLHDGHLHHPHDDHVDEHVIEVSAKNPSMHAGSPLCRSRGRAHASPRMRTSSGAAWRSR
jgi:DNA-binding transcriptional ArsR family regulator